MSSADTTTFPAGAVITAVVTGTNRGKRFFRTRSFTLARDSIEPGFIPASGNRPAEDRIFVEHPHASVPELVVTGSIKADAVGPELINGEEVGVSVDHYGREI